MDGNKLKDPNQTAIHEYYNVFANWYPEKLKQYWLRKLYGTLPSITFKKENNEVIEKNFYKYINEKNMFEFLYRLESKMIKEGLAIVIVDLIMGAKGPEIFLNVSNLILYSEHKTQLEYLEAIGNVNKGTIPLIEHYKFGKYEDVIFYTQDPHYQYTEEETKEIKDTLKYTETNTHNLGFIRARVLTNNIDDYNWNGRPELTPPIITRIELLDKAFSRIITKIELESTHIHVNEDIGISGGKEEYEKKREVIIPKIATQMVGDIKFSSYETENIDNATSTVFQGSPEMTSLQNFIYSEEKEIDQMLGISDDYDSNGKTNDVEAKVDRIGDSAQLEANKRKNYRQGQLREIIEIAMLMLGEKDWDHIQVNLYLNDYRKKMAMLKADPTLIKDLPMIIKLQEVFGFDEQTATKIAKEKEKEIHISVVSLLNQNNGNLPANIDIIKDLEYIDYDRIDKQKAEQNANKLGAEDKPKPKPKEE